MVLSLGNIFQAAEQGQLSKVKEYLEQGTDVNSRDDNGLTPLCHAISPYLAITSSDVIYYLINRGADVNSKDKRGLTPLYRAALLGSKSVAQHLLENGAGQELPSAVLTEDIKYFEKYINKCIDRVEDINQKLGDYTPLQWVAYRSDSPDMISALIENGAEINIQEGQKKRTALHLASLCDNAKNVQKLLLIGANPNIRDFDDKTPIHLAAEKGNMTSAKVLVEYGANLNSKCGIFGLTALSLSQSQEMKEYLNSQGAKREHLASRVIIFSGKLVQEILKYGV
jgi:ankyrin repeat protein